MNSPVLSFNPSAEESKDPPPPSVFGIIVVGLLAGLVVGLLTGPNFTLQGFFLGFAGGALITAGLYFYSAERSRPAR
jgi:predicted lipid-binding transport protein (Tim44 family)